MYRRDPVLTLGLALILLLGAASCGDDDRDIGSDEDPRTATSSAPENPDAPDDDAATTRPVSIAGVDVAESDSSIAVTFFRAPEPCEQFHDATVSESTTEVEITVTVEVREQVDGERCPDVLEHETTTVDLAAPLGDRALLDHDGTPLR
jgi:hypothetical protein